MKILLFLGSGISYESGVPSVGELTKQVLLGDWHEHTDMVFYPNNKDEFVSRIQSFLEILKADADTYLHERWPKKDETNYEGLFYLCRQIHDHEQAEILNPAVWPYVERLRQETTHLCVPLPTTNRPITLVDLAGRACDYIQCVVWHSIPFDKEPQGLSLISELALSDQVDSLDIVTLNHDDLIEKQLLQDGIKFSDGFDEPDGEARYYDPDLLSEGHKKVNLIKLHGATNWFRLREEKKGMNIDRYGIPTHWDVHHLKAKDGSWLSWVGWTPVFLCGSYNKLMDYNFGIFADLQYQFYQALNRHDIMVMSGYGWNDRGINGRIFEWLSSSPDKRLFLLHEKPEDIKEKSKSAMWYRYDEEVKQGRLIPIHKYLKDVSVSDLPLSF